MAALEAFQNDDLNYQLRAGDNTIVAPQQRSAIPSSGSNTPLYSILIEGDETSQTIAGNDVAEEISGQGGDDVLKAAGGDDSLSGGDGADRLIGGSGADALDGGNGVDTVDYRTSTGGIEVSLLDGVGTGGDAEGDVLVLIENVAGSHHADVLTGDEGVNRLQGFGGADQLNGGDGNDRLLGGAGADLLDGGAGVDTADYATSLVAVSVDLSSNSGTGGDAEGDSFVSIEYLSGSDFADHMTGDAGANRLSGVDGDDVLDGKGGIDYLVGGNGDDTLTGGSGADVFVFNAGSGHDTITDFWTGVGRTDRVQLLATGLASFADVQAHLTQSAQGAVLSLNDGADSILFAGVQVSALLADDFVFG